MAVYSFFVLLCAFLSVSAEPTKAPTPNCSISVERQIYGDKAQLANGLRQVYDSLINCPRTESLRLSIFGQHRMFEEEPLNFNFVPGHHFPQLRELCLNGYEFGELRRSPDRQQLLRLQGYMEPLLQGKIEKKDLPPSQDLYIPGANVGSWRRAMDWTALRSLELNGVDNIFFWKMTGRLPAVKNLTIGHNHGFSNVSEYMTDFFTALNPLTNLTTHGYTDAVNWSQILEHHGTTLNRLDIQDWTTQIPNSAAPILSIAQLEEISLLCPGLNELGVNVKMDVEIPYEALDMLALNKNLTTLTIRVRSNHMNVDYGSMNDCYGCSKSLLSSEDFNVSELLWVDSRTVLKIFHYLQSKKQGLELLQLKVFVGNHNTNYYQYPDWVDRHQWMTSKIFCSVVNEEGKRKQEGEAWCHCYGMCTQREFGVMGWDL